MKWNGFSFELFKNIFTHEEISRAVFNTLVIALSSAMLATFIGVFSAVGIFYLRKPLKKTTNATSQITVLNADIMTATAFMLLFMTISQIGIPLPDGYATLIIAHTVVAIPFVILAVNPKLKRLNPNLYEAGLDLGAGHMRTMITVIFPQLITGMVTGFAIAFTLSLEDFIIAQYNKGGIETISTLIFSSIARGLDPTFRALSSVVFITVLAVLLIFNGVSSAKRKSNQEKAQSLGLRRRN
jgi:spermidine/putrescine transport system permease protein